MVDPTLDDNDTLFKMDDIPEPMQPPLPKLTPPGPKSAPKQSKHLGRTPQVAQKSERLGDKRDLINREPTGDEVFGSKPYSPTQKSPF